VKTLFPPYAHPSPELRPDAETWVVRGQPGDGGSPHQALGRIDLDWGSRSLADVLSDVDAWHGEGVQGLFLDRAPASPGGVGPIALVVQLAARRGLRPAVLNPGVPTHPRYRDLGVRICTFDGSWEAYRGWDGEGVQPGDGHIVHGVPTALLTAARQLMARRGAGFGLVTDADPVTAPHRSRAAASGDGAGNGDSCTTSGS
jgi:hypothetical protein